MNEILIALLSAVGGLVIYRLFTQKQADSGQRELEIKSAVIEEKVNNLLDKSKQIDVESKKEAATIRREKQKELNAENLANWFNDRNKP